MISGIPLDLWLLQLACRILPYVYVVLGPPIKVAHQDPKEVSAYDLGSGATGPPAVAPGPAARSDKLCVCMCYSARIIYIYIYGCLSRIWYISVYTCIEICMYVCIYIYITTQICICILSMTRYIDIHV